MTKVLRVLAWPFVWLRDEVYRLCYVSRLASPALLSLLIATFVLFGTGPIGKDQARIVLQSTHYSGLPTLWALTTAWAIMLHWSSRVMLSINFGHVEAQAAGTFRFYAVHLPRLLGFLAFAVIGFALYKAGALDQKNSWDFFAGGAIGLLIYCAWIWRRSVLPAPIKRILRLDRSVDVLSAPLPGAVGVSGGLNAALWRILPSVIFMIGLGVAAEIYFVDVPYSIAPWRSGIHLLIIIFLTFLPVVSVLVAAGLALRVPIFLTVIIAALTIEALDPHQHELRTITEKQLPPRPTLTQAVAMWRAQFDPGGPCAGQPGKDHPILFSAAGGGSRAAYWTALNLSGLDQIMPSFRCQLFAVSSVSGGSVGALSYLRLAYVEPPLPKAAMMQRLMAFNGSDLLGPVIAAWIYRDIPRALLPLIFDQFNVKLDRAGIFEQVLEQRWRGIVQRCWPRDRTCASKLENQGLGDPMSSLAPSAKHWIPIFLADTTLTATGQRVIASPVKIDVRPNDPFVDAIDLGERLEQTNRTIALSTMATASARFPFISPAGIVFDDTKPDAPVRYRLVDGGYFENYGAGEIQSLYDWLTSPENNLKPIVIQSASEPPPESEDLREQDPVGISDAILPMTTVINARTARGVEAALALAGEVRDSDHNLFAQMTVSDEVAVSWTLSDAAKDLLCQSLLTALQSDEILAIKEMVDPHAPLVQVNCTSGKWRGAARAIYWRAKRF